MIHESLQEIHGWARTQLDLPVLLGYRLYKVNGQVPGSVLVLVRRPGVRRAEAEIQIDYTPHPVSPYRTSFMLLPFVQNPKEVPRPNDLWLHFKSQQAVIHWLKTGRIMR